MDPVATPITKGMVNCIMFHSVCGFASPATVAAPSLVGDGAQLSLHVMKKHEPDRSERKQQDDERESDFANNTHGCTYSSPERIPGHSSSARSCYLDNGHRPHPCPVLVASPGPSLAHGGLGRLGACAGPG